MKLLTTFAAWFLFSWPAFQPVISNKMARYFRQLRPGTMFIGKFRQSLPISQNSSILQPR
ncbi:MAG: hypothetical protein BGO52_14065 [Sphingobacteriales bacterium 44-61]|nr:MAG: hypothetical protein BGO52_14065 [Sphingobacteriales bacterium 44-61]